MNVLVLILQGLLGALFSWAAIQKLTRSEHMVTSFEDFELPYSLALASAAVEIVTGPALLIGLAVPVLAGLAAIAQLPVMAGATYVNFTRQPVGFGIGTLVIVGLLMLIASYHLGDVRSLLRVS